VDGFHPVNVGKLHLGRPTLVPCTPAGIIRLIESTGVAVACCNAVVIGRSDIVGKPMAALLLQANATVTIAHSRTRDLAAAVGGADIVVAAAAAAHGHQAIPARCCAARTVFLSSMAIVIGPTPPGTGVRRPATSRALAASTSPTIT